MDMGNGDRPDIEDFRFGHTQRFHGYQYKGSISLPAVIPRMPLTWKAAS